MILIVTYPGEEHAAEVIRRLEARGLEVTRLDLADLPARAPMSFGWPAEAPPEYVVHTAAGAVDLARARVGWWRRVRPHEVDPAVTDPSLRAFAASETAQAVQGVLDALACPWVNPRAADEAAHHKPLQWTLAREAGLSVPRTLVTTRPEDARAFVEEMGEGRVVCKAFLAMLEAWRETRLVSKEDRGRLELVRYAPVIFQEYVPGVDVRVTVIGGKIFAAEIDARRTSYPVDMRMVVGESVVRPVELPSGVRAALLRLLRRLGLVYGAVDFRRADDGDWRFLEVNPAGQWLFVEHRTGLPISEAVADYLAAVAVESPAYVMQR